MTGRPVVIVLASAQRRGAEIQGLGLGKSLVARGHDARVVALAPGGGEPLDVEVLGRGARAPSTLRALRRAIRSAIVVAHGSTSLPAVAAATLGTGAPWIYRSIGDPRFWVRGPLRRLRTGALLARADRVVVLWDGAAESMRSLYRVPSRRIVVIPNSRSPAQFPLISAAERAAARARMGVDGQVVLYLGALSEEKQPLDAVRAVARLPGATLIVAGHGPLAAEVEALGDRLAPGRVRLIGETADPAGTLAAADVLVLTSRTEGMPGVIMEARLRGVPVVATAVGAVPAMVTVGVDGAVVAPGDPEGLRRALEAVLLVPLGQWSADRDVMVARYGEDAVVTRWQELLAGLDERRSGPRWRRGRSAPG